MLRERDSEKENVEAERIALMHAIREEGKSFREIAEIMDCSVSTVHKYLTKVN
ncbi:MAG: helix-turn-helix domain-containing protein [Alistipes sp.]|nr:helix-turn-helix domain-containing protein [Alistipes sp.]